MNDKSHDSVLRTVPSSTAQNHFTDERVVQVNLILDSSEQDKEIRHFLGEARPNRYVLKTLNKKKIIFKKPSKDQSFADESVTGQETRDSPSEAPSYESFHSCHSFHELNSTVENDHKLSSQFAKKENIIADRSLSNDPPNQLTLVNAIFLNNSTNQNLQHLIVPNERQKETFEGKHSRSSKTFSTLEYKPCSKNVKICKNYHNTEYKIKNKYGHGAPRCFLNNYQNKTTQNLEDDILEAQEIISKLLREHHSFSADFLSDDNISDNKLGISSINDANILNTSSSFENIFNKSQVLVIKIPERNFEEVLLVSQSSYLISSVIYEGQSISNKIEETKTSLKIQKTVSCCEPDSKSNDQRDSLTSFPPDGVAGSQEESNFGDGDFSSTGNPMLEFDSEKSVSKSLDNFDDFKLRKFVRKILNNIYNEPTNYSELNTNNGQIETYIPTLEKKYSPTTINDCKDGFKSKFYKITEETSNKNISNDDECSLSHTRDDFRTDDVNIFWMNKGSEDCEKENGHFAQTVSLKRKFSERINLLPVIKEEKSKEKLEESSYLSDGSNFDEVFLVDSQRRPICLFDSRDLPLTDFRGRVLKTAQGEPLLKCDEDGIPLVDLSSCDIFDMHGRQPYDDDFQPSESPKAAAFVKKLFTRDGKPLLLFDCEGYPLTTVSGTVLLDSKGRGLVQIS